MAGPRAPTDLVWRLSADGQGLEEILSKEGEEEERRGKRRRAFLPFHGTLCFRETPQGEVVADLGSCALRMGDSYEEIARKLRLAGREVAVENHHGFAVVTLLSQ